MYFTQPNYTIVGKACPVASESPLDCVTGHYSLGNSTSCLPCPSGHMCPFADRLPEECPPGHYSTAKSMLCLKCGKGYACPGNATNERIRYKIYYTLYLHMYMYACAI